MLDNLRARFRAEYRREKAKLAEMSWPDRRWYIWAYYKLHIIIGGLLVLLAGYCVYFFVINPPKEYYVSFALYGEYVPTEVALQFRQNMNEVLDVNRKKQTVMTFNFYYNENNAALSTAMSQKYYALVMVKQLDFILTDSADFSAMAQNGEYLPLDQILTESQLASLGDRVAWEHKSNELTSHPYGLKMDGNPVLYDNNLWSRGKLLAVCVTTQRKERVAQTIRVFFPQMGE